MDSGNPILILSAFSYGLAKRFTSVTIAHSEVPLSVGFQLLGKFENTLSAPDDILRELESWVREYAADLVPSTRIGFSEADPTLFCRLHPAAEDVYFYLPDLDHLVVSATTSTVGPGYHIFVCDMVRRLGENFRLTWITDNEEYLDETDYLSSGDEQRVFDEMTNWLSGLCSCFFNGTFKHEPDDLPTLLCLPIGVAFEAEAPAVTPLGPRDLDWLKKVSEDGKQGSDFFAWWKPGLNAEYFLGRALARMWSEVRWRNPVNESERETLTYVAYSLETAFKLDPSLSYPWAEWAQVLNFLERADPEADFVRSRATEAPWIGYRRRNVRETLPGNWILNVPGAFSEFEADEEGDFSAQDPPRVIWFTSYTFADKAAQRFSSAQEEMIERGPALLERRDGYIGSAEIQEKGQDGEKYFVLSSSNVCKMGRAVVSVIFVDAEDRTWAEGVWRSLQPPRGGASD